MKIKKFRIRPRLPSVGRILKALLSVKQLPADLEESIPAESSSFLEQVVPAAFYHTWTREDMPPFFNELLKPVGLDKSLAITALVATIGQGPENLIAETLMAGETNRAQLLTALSEESADLSFNFLCRLLVDDAKSDDCEVSPPVMLTNPDALSGILKLLEADQEGVTLDSASHLSPRFTRVALTAWLPINKRKKLASFPKSKS